MNRPPLHTGYMPVLCVRTQPLQQRLSYSQVGTTYMCTLPPTAKLPSQPYILPALTPPPSPRTLSINAYVTTCYTSLFWCMRPSRGPEWKLSHSASYSCIQSGQHVDPTNTEAHTGSSSSYSPSPPYTHTHGHAHRPMRPDTQVQTHAPLLLTCLLVCSQLVLKCHNAISGLLNLY